MLDNAGAQPTAEATDGHPTYIPFTPESPDGPQDAPALYREASTYRSR
jgi:hypothetical protein